MLSRATVVPAGTGIYVKADKAGEYTVPTTDNNMYYYSNLFVGLPKGGTVQPTEMVDGEKFITLNLAKSKTTGKPAFFPLQEPKTYGENKMYLHLPARLLPEYDTVRNMCFEIAFEDDATGISEIENMRKAENEAIFNLAGQRVMKAQKGLYIVNGKKTLVK